MTWRGFASFAGTRRSPVIADESARGPREVLELVRREAVDLLHFG
jgi:hypothetical protein